MRLATCLSTTEVISALAASRVRPFQKIRTIRDPDAGAARNWNAGSIPSPKESRDGFFAWIPDRSDSRINRHRRGGAFGAGALSLSRIVSGGRGGHGPFFSLVLWPGDRLALYCSRAHIRAP